MEVSFFVWITTVLLWSTNGCISTVIAVSAADVTTKTRTSTYSDGKLSVNSNDSSVLDQQPIIDRSWKAIPATTGNILTQATENIATKATTEKISAHATRENISTQATTENISTQETDNISTQAITLRNGDLRLDATPNTNTQTPNADASSKTQQMTNGDILWSFTSPDTLSYTTQSPLTTQTVNDDLSWDTTKAFDDRSTWTTGQSTSSMMRSSNSPKDLRDVNKTLTTNGMEVWETKPTPVEHLIWSHTQSTDTVKTLPHGISTSHATPTTDGIGDRKATPTPTEYSAWSISQNNTEKTWATTPLNSITTASDGTLNGKTTPTPTTQSAWGTSRNKDTEITRTTSPLDSIATMTTDGIKKRKTTPSSTSKSNDTGKTWTAETSYATMTTEDAELWKTTPNDDLIWNSTKSPDNYNLSLRMWYEMWRCNDIMAILILTFSVFAIPLNVLSFFIIYECQAADQRNKSKVCVKYWEIILISLKKNYLPVSI